MKHINRKLRIQQKQICSFLQVYFLICQYRPIVLYLQDSNDIIKLEKDKVSIQCYEVTSVLIACDDRESQRATERVYELIVKDPNKTLNYETLKKVTEEIGDKTPNEDLQRLIKNGASNDADISYEEFHSIMTKEVSLK